MSSSILSLLLACDVDVDAGATATDARTLSTCETDIPDDAPDFYAKYFRCVTVIVDDDEIGLSSTGLPPHPSPYYPSDDANWEEWDDRGGDWFQNPNVIAEQSLLLRVANDPVSKGLTITEDLVDLEAGTSTEEYGGMPMGLALDGTALFHGVAAPGDDIRDEAFTFDRFEGHPEMTGTYHHHSATPASLAVLVAAGLATSTVPGAAEIELYGIMCDGTLLLGCTELDGSAPSTDDLDAQSGHVHDLLDEEGTVHFSQRYHTHLCDALATHEFTPEIAYYQGCDSMGPP